jgi:hypothetical protein
MAGWQQVLRGHGEMGPPVNASRGSGVYAMWEDDATPGATRPAPRLHPEADNAGEQQECLGYDRAGPTAWIDA